MLFKNHKRTKRLKQINHRVPYLTYTPVEYSIHNEFFNRKAMYKLIDEQSDVIFTGDIDALNKDIADNPILAMARSNILNLLQQRMSHEEVITHIESRKNSDLEDIQQQKEKALQDLDKAKVELENLIQMKEGTINV